MILKTPYVYELKLSFHLPTHSKLNTLLYSSSRSRPMTNIIRDSLRINPTPGIVDPRALIQPFKMWSSNSLQSECPHLCLQYAYRAFQILDSHQQNVSNDIVQPPGLKLYYSHRILPEPLKSLLFERPENTLYLFIIIHLSK